MVYRLANAGKVLYLSLDLHLSAVCLMDSGNDLCKGGFSCAVFSHQRMDLSASQVKVDSLYGNNSGEHFFDIGHFNQNFIQSSHFP